MEKNIQGMARNLLKNMTFECICLKTLVFEFQFHSDFPFFFKLSNILTESR